MPTRMIRDWTTSERVDQLSEGAEIFFTRLIMKADDYGCFHGSPKLLNAFLFPLRDYELGKIIGWARECSKIGLIQRYSIDGKDYIRILDFKQRLRAMKSKFPLPVSNPPSNDGHMSGNSRPELEEEVEEETEVEHEGATAQVCVWPTFDDFWNLYDKKEDRPKCEKKWKKISQGTREKIMLHVEEYVKATPDKQYRKHPTTYLNNESWNNEIIKSNGKTGFNLDESARRIDEILKARGDH